MPERICDRCSKTFVNRQSLYLHRKRHCKGSNVHVPVPITYEKSSGEQVMKRIHKSIEDADDKVSRDTDDDTMDENSSAEEFSDDEERYDHQLWIILCIKCFKHDLSIYECMFRTLALNFALEKDVPYQEIMEDVEKKERQGLSFVDALDNACLL